MTRRTKILFAAIRLPLGVLGLIFWRPIVFVVAVLLYSAWHKLFG
jgi:hypothetical protein